MRYVVGVRTSNIEFLDLDATDHEDAQEQAEAMVDTGYADETEIWVEDWEED